VGQHPSWDGKNRCRENIVETGLGTTTRQEVTHNAVGLMSLHLPMYYDRFQDKT